MLTGREMDALVAEKIMGSVPCDGWSRFHIGEMMNDMKCEHEMGKCFPKKAGPPMYSTSISAAWQVMEHFRQNQWKVSVIGNEWYDGASWICVMRDAIGEERGTGIDKKSCTVVDGKQGWDEPSAPLAICRAALKTVGKNETF